MIVISFIELEGTFKSLSNFLNNFAFLRSSFESLFPFDVTTILRLQAQHDFLTPCGTCAGAGFDLLWKHFRHAEQLPA